MRPQRIGLTALIILATIPLPLPLGLPAPSSASRVLAQTPDARKASADELLNLCKKQIETSQFQAALKSCQQALTIYQTINDRTGEANSLYNLGFAYALLGQYQKATEYYQQALTSYRGIKNRTGEANSLIGLDTAHDFLQYQKATEHYNRAGKATSPGNLGNVSFTPEAGKLLSLCKKQLETSQSQAALKSCKQALTIYRASNNYTGERSSLIGLGVAYYSLGQYQKAIESYQQALAIAPAIGHRIGEDSSLIGLGSAYLSLGQYQKAIESYQQALAIARAIGDHSGEGSSLSNLGGAYYSLGQYQKAIESYQQALVIARAINKRAGEAISLNNLGIAYRNLGQYQKAIESYQQALAIRRAIGDRAGEGSSLNNIGSMLNRQKQPELAIVFYKQSVNVREAIRQDIRGLPREQQESYTETVAGSYRSLANLLLSQGRILEAQQVLELLKVQELRDFTRNARAGGKTDGVAVNSVEAEILKEHGTLIAFGQQVDQCKQARCSQLRQLNDRLEALTQQYNQTVKTFAQAIRDRAAQDKAILDPEDLSRKAKEIVEAQPGTVLVYPFVLEDKTWLLWASSGGVVKSVAVPVKRQQLGETALKFRQLLESPDSDITEVKATGKQLYDWLIKPLEPELKANKIQNLVFSLDRVTRYLPMSALFDGKQYLVENYTVSTVLSADLTDTRDRLPSGTQNTKVLGLGLSNAVAGFNSLPNVPAELDAIVRQNSSDKGIYPGLKFLNSRFDRRTLRDNLLGRKVLHVATHGKFVPGRPEDSFLVLGTGERLTIPEIETLPDLDDVHLVVLSACETALGGPDQDGVEISGISYYFLNGGAKAVMASLWLVNDESTRLSMQQFYSHLANGTAKTPMTKAMSLRQAQLSLLHGKVSTDNVDPRAGGIVVELRPGRTAQPSAETNFSHPYYWAPFILIGNGL